MNIINLLIAISFLVFALNASGEKIEPPPGVSAAEFNALTKFEQLELIKRRNLERQNIIVFLKDIRVDLTAKNENDFEELNKKLEQYLEFADPKEKRHIRSLITNSDLTKQPTPDPLFKAISDRRKESGLLKFIPDDVRFDQNLSFSQKVAKAWELIDAHKEGKNLRGDLEQILAKSYPYENDREKEMKTKMDPIWEKEMDSYCQGDKGGKIAETKDQHGKVTDRNCQCEGWPVTFKKHEFSPDFLRYLFIDNKCPNKEYLDFKKKQEKDGNKLKIEKEDCKGGRPLKEGGDPTFSDRHKRVRNQHGHGYCWGFAGAAILEDYYFSKEGKQIEISPFHLISQSEGGTTLQSLSEGGQVKELLEGAALNGACAEELSPYPQNCYEIEKYSTYFWGIPKDVHRNCLALKLKKKYFKVFAKIQSITGDSCDVADVSAVQDQKSIKNLEKDLEKIVKYLSTSVEDRQSIANKLENSHGNFQKFLDSIIISDKCKQENNLNVFSDLKRYKAEYSSGSNPAEVNGQARAFYEIKKVIAADRPLALHICASKLEQQNAGGIVSSGECGAHEVVATNYRWNSEKNICEIYIRNSWGSDDTAIHGWKPMVEVLSTIKGVDYILPSKGKEGQKDLPKGDSGGDKHPI